MIWGGLVASALAGQLGLAHPEDVYTFDTRTFSMTFWGSLPLGYETGDIAFDSGAQLFVVEAYGWGRPDCILELYQGVGIGTCLAIPFVGGVAYDDGGVFFTSTRNAEYFPPRDIFVSLYNGIVSVDQAGNTWPIAPVPVGFGFPWYSLAWDEDLNLLWLVNLDPDVNVVALDPTSFTPVVFGQIPLGGMGATGAYDDTPNQTPILFVSGTCPGDLTVTIADATPGEAVRVVSSARPGRTTVPTGPCRGTRADLANPQPRATLVADAFGLATTHVQATPAMCGRTLVQALDEGSCLVTDVVAVPAVP